MLDLSITMTFAENKIHVSIKYVCCRTSLPKTLGFDPLFGFFDENDNFNEMNNTGRIKVVPKLFDNGNFDGLHLHLKSEEILTQAPQKYPILSQVPKDLELLQS